MQSRRIVAGPGLAIVAIVLAGCGTVADQLNHPATTPEVIKGYQFVSAGYTGCQPADNAISAPPRDLGIGEIWQATCKGKTYLCTSRESTSCAPVAQ